MGKQAQITGNWKSGKDFINMKLAVIMFEEDGSQIMYCPALDISGYGKNAKDAHQSFEISLSEFFQYTLNKNTFKEVLSGMGWTVKKSKHKPMYPPDMSELLQKNDNFNRIFNNYDFKKMTQNISLPAYA